jgi:signal transduction histidine kinase
LAIGGWLLLVALGTAGIAIAVVYRMTKPLILVQRAIAHIDPSGDTPILLERGSPEVRAMARAINTLSLRLKNAMESRMRLVAVAGHDLRTPMTRMRLRAEFLEDDDREKWISDLDELDHIADSAIRLVHEETEIAPTNPIHLDEMVSKVITELQELKLNVRLEHKQPVCVYAHPLSLKRALRNLIINAATHGGGAKVSMSVDEIWVIISIGDRGPGIPEALLERAFEPFFRVEQMRKQSVPGAGLGLAIAKEIIQRNLGKLTISNRLGGGLMQCIELPRCHS